MHYSNGREAKLGDLVRGRGYNVKHEIIGRLITARPQETACNCTVAYVGVNSEVKFTAYIAPENSDWLSSSNAQVTASIEYGQLDGFVAIDPNTGDVLPERTLPRGHERPLQ
jgi:hypothetical protein